MKRKNPYPKLLTRKWQSLKRLDKQWTLPFTAKMIDPNISDRSLPGWMAGESTPTGLYKKAVDKFLSKSNAKLRKEVK